MSTVTRGSVLRLRMLPSVPIGASTFTLNPGDHAFRNINMDQTAGVTVTLPPATGSGALFQVRQSVVPTSNSNIIRVANSADTMEGFVEQATAAGAKTCFWANPATADTITLNRSTTGGTVIGEYIELEDVAPNRWAVRGFTQISGTAATPFSATV